MFVLMPFVFLLFISFCRSSLLLLFMYYVIIITHISRKLLSNNSLSTLILLFIPDLSFLHVMQILNFIIIIQIKIMCHMCIRVADFLFISKYLLTFTELKSCRYMKT